MRRTVMSLTVAASLLAAVAAGDVYDDLVTYDWGDGRAVPFAIENDVRDAADADALRAVEAKLLKALANPKATQASKQLVCRLLRKAGSPACVPELAKLLTDEKLSHMARWALQHSPAPEATAALLEALGKTKGKLKIGMVTSLGERGDPRAVPAVAKLTAANDAELARAAVHALGRIASSEAAAALAKASVGGALRTEWADASLRCADKTLAKGDAAAAAAVYRKLFAKDNPRMIRIAALRGLVGAEKARAVPTLLGLMRGGEADLAQAATRFAIELEGKEVTAALAAALAGMPTEAQARLLDVLTDRRDPAAASAVRGLLASQDEGIRVAAIRALGVIGDAASVEPLARLVSKGGAVGNAASSSLNRLKGEGVAEAMGKLLDASEPALRAGILSVLATRADKSMAPLMLKAARDKDEAVRKAACKGLEATAGEKELAPIVDLLLSAASTSEQSVLEKALSAAARRVGDLEARSEPIVAGLARAEPAIKVRLLATLGKLGGEKALAAGRGQLGAREADVATAAVRALSDWPDAAPAADLLRIIKTTTDKVHKVLAFRGYMRMANLVAERASSEAMAMYRQALGQAATVDEKKSVLGGLSSARSIEALELVEPLLAEAAVRAEAELAVVQIAGNCRDTAPTEARATLKKLIASSKNAGLRKRAQGTINEMDKNIGFVRTWLGAGPYTEGDRWKTAYPPEKGDEGVEWKLLTKGVGAQVIDLDQAVANGDNRAAYMKTFVFSPEDQDVRLEIGSDDAVKMWVGDKLAHVNNANRPCKPGQDKAKAHLAKGWNRLLMKIVDNSGQWAFCLRIVKPDGSVLEGLRVSVEAQ